VKIVFEGMPGAARPDLIGKTNAPDPKKAKF
jgi:hypothetical protein